MPAIYPFIAARCSICALILSQALAAILLAPSAAAAGEGRLERIISTDAGATEILLELGLGERLVAVDSTSQLPEGLGNVPRLGYHRALAAEGLLAQAPQLVVGSEHMGPPHVVATLERANVPILLLDSAHSLSGLRQNIEILGRTLDAQDRSRQLLAALGEQERALNERPGAQLAAVFLLAGEGGKLRMAGAHTGGAAFIELLGARNLAEYPSYRSVSAEALLELAPDMLLIADTQNLGIGPVLDKQPLLKYGTAVQSGQVYAVDANALVAGISLAAVAEASAVKTKIESGLVSR